MLLNNILFSITKSCLFIIRSNKFNLLDLKKYRTEIIINENIEHENEIAAP